jgi:two-component system, cell cycle sensor histidine kinase and response regulator CckA
MERADFDQWKPKEVARLLALVETERRYYQEIVANLPVSLAIVGPDLKVLSSNRHFRSRLGKKNDEVLGQDLSGVLEIEGLSGLAKQVVESGLPAPRLEATWRENPVSVHALPLRGWEEDSEAEALLFLEERIVPAPVELPRTPRELKSVELSDAVGAMLWEADLASGKLTHVNREAEKLFGYPEAEWLEKDEIWTERVAPHDRERVKRFYASVHDTEAAELTVEFEGRRLDGASLIARESIRIVRDENGKPMRLLGCTTDISQRRESEDQHATFMKSEALYRLSAKLAHDLNNLLMIVAGYGEELKTALPVTHPLHGDMRQILEATERLYSVTTQLQTYTRRPMVTPKSTDVAQFLEGVRPLLERGFGANVELRVECAPNLGRAKMDTGHVEHALAALAQHAFLEMGGSGLVVLRAVNAAVGESTGRSGSLEAGDYVRITLSHSGSAMSPEARERLLEPWLYSDDAIRDVKLSLANAYQVARHSGGDIRVDGEGFHLYLPMVSRAEREAERAAAKAAPGEGAPMLPVAEPEPEPQLESILVVEDESAIRALVRKILKRQGYQVLEASNGDEALRVLAEQNGSVDLLLTDVMMPGMNGVDLSQKAVAEWPGIRVLFVSGYTDENVLEGGQFPVGTAFLQKPFTLVGLLGKVREVLDAGKTQEAAG